MAVVSNTAEEATRNYWAMNAELVVARKSKATLRRAVQRMEEALESTDWCSEEMPGTKPTCPVCGKHFVKRSNIYHHLRRVHHTEPELPGIKCPECYMRVRKQADLLQHLRSAHEKVIDVDEILLSSLEDFYQWKKIIERATLSSYVQHTGRAKLADGTEKLFYRCHREGNYIDKLGGNRRRRLKSQGTNKIGSGCSSFMDVELKNGVVLVQYCRTHIGHGLSHLPPREHKKQHELAEESTIFVTAQPAILTPTQSSPTIVHLTRASDIPSANDSVVSEVMSLLSGSNFTAEEGTIQDMLPAQQPPPQEESPKQRITEKIHRLLQCLGSSDVEGEAAQNLESKLDDLLELATGLQASSRSSHLENSLDTLLDIAEHALDCPKKMKRKSANPKKISGSTSNFQSLCLSAVNKLVSEFGVSPSDSGSEPENCNPSTTIVQPAPPIFGV